jgi:muramoyltetrapeptide carboxypeptidase
VPTLHAPNVGGDSFTAFPDAQHGLRRALFEPDRPDTRVLAWDGADRVIPGRAAGLTAGGNLSLLAAGLGTPDGRQPGPSGRGFAGCILLLEDVREEGYRLDRMLTQLLRAGALDGVRGIALGSWTDCGPPETVRRVMQDRLGGLGVPVAWGLPFGHTAPQPTIPLGVPAELDAGLGALAFLEHAVA